MSYSCGARGATRVEVIDAISKQLEDVLISQPVHAADIETAQVAALAYLAALPDADDDQDYRISMFGSVSWSRSDPDGKPLGIYSINSGCTADLVKKGAN